MSGSGPAARAWKEAVAACTVGVERAGVPALPDALDGLAAVDGADGLLLAVAAMGPWRMVGRVPDPAGAALVGSMPETLPECSGAAASQLEVLLTHGGFHGNAGPAVCQEWCGLAVAAGVRAPPGLAGALFNLVRTKPWADEVEAVFGARLSWLRGLDGAAPPEPDVADWSSPDLPRRVAALRLMRVADPAAAHAALAAAWQAEPADARARLLAALPAGLCMDDEPFLEGCLDDRSMQVRAEAARLLAGLPGSRWAARMRARAAAAVQVRPGGILSRDALAVTLPSGDDAARRDRLDAKGAPGSGAALLHQLAAAAPLASWDGPPPDRWVKLALAGDWAAALVPGWAAAAARERNGAWLTALLDALTDVPKPLPWIAQALHAIAPALPVAELERAALSTLRGGPQQLGSLLQACAHRWSLGFTRAVLDWVASKPSVSAGTDHALHNAMRSALDLLAIRGSVDAAGWLAAIQAGLPDGAAPTLRRALDDAAATLRFRLAMHQEFAR